MEFTDEELAAASERIKARGGLAKPRQPETTADLLADFRIPQSVLDREERRRALPCFAPAEAGDASAALAACEAASAAEGCEFRRSGDFCAVAGRERRYAEIRERLSESGVPSAYAQRVLQHFAQHGPPVAPLATTEAMKLVKGFMRAPESAGVVVDSGNTIAFTGNEWALVLSGDKGVGKSIAAAFALSRLSGAWLWARRSLGDVDFDLAEAERTRLLVLDDLGTEYSGANGYAVERAAALLELRHAEGRRTIVTTNLLPAAIEERYGARLLDRLRERARVVLCGGSSMRGGA